jgi:hypothetical protein
MSYQFRKYIKFTMSRGEPIILPEDKALKVLQSQEQVVMIKDENNEWDGTTINKAHIVSTAYDNDTTRDRLPRIAPPEEKPRGDNKAKEYLQREKEKLIQEKILKP